MVYIPRELAQSAPVLFFQTYKPPILIDEVQKESELLLDIVVYSSHRIEETASAYAENGYNGAILEKKVQNSLSAITKSERMLAKMDIMGHQEAKIPKIK